MTRVVVLAGGLGTRLRPYTVSLPKPLMPVVDRPILEIIVRQLAKHGVDHITLAVNHQADLLKAFFGDGSRWGVTIDYSLEVEPLGTMGPLRDIADLPENFLVMNGDILTDLDYGAFISAHIAEKRLFTVSASLRQQKIDYGVLQVDGAARLTGFREKPATDYLVSMGIYCVNRRAVQFIPESGAYGFDQLMLQLIAKGEDVRVVPHRGYWLDIGRPDDYQKAIEDWPTVSATMGI